jgi:hypothetical protein
MSKKDFELRYEQALIIKIKKESLLRTIATKSSTFL